MLKQLDPVNTRIRLGYTRMTRAPASMCAMSAVHAGGTFHLTVALRPTPICDTQPSQINKVKVGGQQTSSLTPRFRILYVPMFLLQINLLHIGIIYTSPSKETVLKRVKRFYSLKKLSSHQFHQQSLKYEKQIIT